MNGLGEYFHWQRMEGTPVRRRQLTVTPISQAIGVTTPYGGFHWNRPKAVRVESEEGVSQIAIVDLTLAIQLSLLALTFILFILGWRADRKTAGAGPTPK